MLKLFVLLGVALALLLSPTGRGATTGSRYTSIDAADDEEVVGKVLADPLVGTKLGTVRERFCAEMSDGAEGQASEALKWIEDQTRTLKSGHFLTGHLPGSVLQTLVMLQKAKRVLEIGSYTGYSAVAMAAAGAEVTTIDSFEGDSSSKGILLEGIRRSGPSVRLEEGQALDVLARLEKDGSAPFDFVFMDADKSQQIDYYEFLMGHPRLLSPDGAICVDNTLWYSRVLNPSVLAGDEVTQAIMAFNRHVRDDPRSFVTVIPLRDGLTVIQRRRQEANQ